MAIAGWAEPVVMLFAAGGHICVVSLWAPASPCLQCCPVLVLLFHGLVPGWSACLLCAGGRQQLGGGPPCVPGGRPLLLHGHQPQRALPGRRAEQLQPAGEGWAKEASQHRWLGHSSRTWSQVLLCAMSSLCQLHSNHHCMKSHSTHHMLSNAVLI